MTPVSTGTSLAVLIDGENMSAKYAEAIFAEIASFGEASVRRVYGDFSTNKLKGWKDVMAELAIIPQQQFQNTIGKNADDIALVIDAMDLLHSGRFDGFVLVSSDSDFTRLASRIREQNIEVIGVGEKKTPQPFRKACHRFIYVESLLGQRVVQDGENLTLSHAGDLIGQALNALSPDNEPVALGPLGQELRKRFSDFDHRNYGKKSLSDLISALKSLELKGTGTEKTVRKRSNG